MSVQNNWDFRLRVHEYSVSGIPRSSERDWSLHFDSLHAAYVALLINLCFICWLFCYCYIEFMKQQQKWSLFFVQKRLAVEPENQGDGLDKDCEVEEPLKLQEPISSSSTTNTEKFQW